jgi:hypothetical protein
VRDLQRRLGFPVRVTAPDVSTLPDGAGPADGGAVRPAAATRPPAAKPKRLKADWAGAAGAAAPRRKPDGRPVRSGSRRRSGSPRFRSG